MEIRILGIDPGNYKTGYSIISIKGNKCDLIDSDVIISKKRPDNLKKIYNTLSEIIDLHNINEIALESSFFSKNVQSLIRLGEVRGVILLLSSIFDLEIYEYTPQRVKNAITGYGWSGKDQVLQMVKHIFKKDVKNHDEADAIAVAFCHFLNRNCVKL